MCLCINYSVESRVVLDLNADSLLSMRECNTVFIFKYNNIHFPVLLCCNTLFIIFIICEAVYSVFVMVTNTCGFFCLYTRNVKLCSLRL